MRKKTDDESASPFSLNCFGVGDGWPCANRNHSAFLYHFGRTSLLIDCGEPVSGRFKATGLKYDTIDRIFLSHLHCDHVGGLFMLLQGFWLEQRQKDLTIHLPASGIAPIRQMLDAACIFEELLPFRLHFEPLQSGQAVTVGDVRVTPHPTTHLDSLRDAYSHKYGCESFVAHSFLLEAGGLRMGHSADIGAAADLKPLLAEPLDLLVCELAHCRPEDLLTLLRGRPIKRILFVHLARRYWENLGKIRAQIRRELGGIPFAFAHDDERFVIQPGK